MFLDILNILKYGNDELDFLIFHFHPLVILCPMRQPQFRWIVHKTFQPEWTHQYWTIVCQCQMKIDIFKINNEMYCC